MWFDFGQPLADALARAVRARFKGITCTSFPGTAAKRRHKIWTCLVHRAESATAPGGAPPGPLVIVQDISREDVDQARDRKFPFRSNPVRKEDPRSEGENAAQPEGKDDFDSRASPFTHRLSVERFRALTGPMLVEKRYAAFSVPIIFCGRFDLPKESRRGEREPVPGQNRPSSGAGTVSRERDLLFLDSSIWHRFVSRARRLGDHHRSWHEDFLDTVAEIRGYWAQQLYRANVALEHLDYSLRMYRHRRLADFAEHGHWITLHGFQSESQASQDADRVEASLGIKDAFPCSLLLVDDFSTKPLESILGAKIPSKKDIVLRALSAGHKSDDRARRDHEAAVGSRLATAESVNKLQERLESLANHSDIILLDFLLGPGKEPFSRETGVDVVRLVDPDDPGKATKLDPGLLGKWWIFSFSAFHSAFMAAVERGQVSTVHPSWHILTGADPVNTPQLFRLRLLKFIEVIESFLGDTPLAFLVKQLSKFDDAATAKRTARWVRDTARNLYPRLIEHRAKLQSLKLALRKSALAKHLWNDRHWNTLEEPLEHLTLIVELLEKQPEYHWWELHAECVRLTARIHSFCDRVGGDDASRLRERFESFRKTIAGVVDEGSKPRHSRVG